MECPGRPKRYGVRTLEAFRNCLHPVRKVPLGNFSYMGAFGVLERHLQEV